MSNVKEKTPVGGGCARDVISKTVTVCCRQKVPSCHVFILLLLLLFSLGASHMEFIESHSEFSCEPIRLRMCQDLPYNTTFMPNLLNHYDQQTAALAMEVGVLFLIHLKGDSCERRSYCELHFLYEARVVAGLGNGACRVSS